MSLECAITTLHLVLQTLALEQIWKANGHNGKAISWSQISQWVTLQVSKIGSLAWSWNSTNTYPNLCPLVQCSRNFVNFHGIQGAGMHQINFLVCTHSTVGNVFRNVKRSLFINWFLFNWFQDLILATNDVVCPSYITSGIPGASCCFGIHVTNVWKRRGGKLKINVMWYTFFIKFYSIANPSIPKPVYWNAWNVQLAWKGWGSRGGQTAGHASTDRHPPSPRRSVFSAFDS